MMIDQRNPTNNNPLHAKSVHASLKKDLSLIAMGLGMVGGALGVLMGGGVAATAEAAQTGGIENLLLESNLSLPTEKKHLMKESIAGLKRKGRWTVIEKNAKVRNVLSKISERLQKHENEPLVPIKSLHLHIGLQKMKSEIDNHIRLLNYLQQRNIPALNFEKAVLDTLAQQSPTHKLIAPLFSRVSINEVTSLSDILQGQYDMRTGSKIMGNIQPLSAQARSLLVRGHIRQLRDIAITDLQDYQTQILNPLINMTQMTIEDELKMHREFLSFFIRKMNDAESINDFNEALIEFHTASTKNLIHLVAHDTLYDSPLATGTLENMFLTDHPYWDAGRGRRTYQFRCAAFNFPSLVTKQCNIDPYSLLLPTQTFRS